MASHLRAHRGHLGVALHHKDTSPVTGATLESRVLILNHLVRCLLRVPSTLRARCLRHHHCSLRASLDVIGSSEAHGNRGRGRWHYVAERVARGHVPYTRKEHTLIAPGRGCKSSAADTLTHARVVCEREPVRAVCAVPISFAHIVYEGKQSRIVHVTA